MVVRLLTCAGRSTWSGWNWPFCVLLFFYSFDLSFAFIRRKIGFLLYQGLVMTLYISAGLDRHRLGRWP